LHDESCLLLMEPFLLKVCALNMDYNQLSSSYWSEQLERIRDVLDRINGQTQAAVPGRVVPGQDDLALGTGRSLNAAIVFTDICKFSGRRSGTATEQNDLLRVLNLYFSEMIKVAEEYGGTVEKNTGDGLMAYFEDNAGEPKESGCTRALASAMTMMYVNENALNPILERSTIEPIKFRIGIDYGPVTIAQLGAARRFGGLVAIGATANIASKMLNEAAPGDILIGEDVYKQVPADWNKYCSVHNLNTGWVYLSTGLPYWFYKFTGRWTGPL
jgi:adenylate cyclase